MILKGAGGGSSTFVGGSGAFVSGNLAVTPFETLTILVGGGGGNGTTVDAGGGGLSAISLNRAEVADAGGGGGLFGVTNNNGENGSVTLTFASAAPIPEASTLLSFGLLTLGGGALTVYKRSRARI